MSLGTKVGFSPGHIVLNGDHPAASPRKGHNNPDFSAHVYCCQTTGCIRIPLGMGVGLGPGDIVLDGDPAFPPRKGALQPRPHFSAHFALARSPISATAELLLHLARYVSPDTSVSFVVELTAIFDVHSTRGSATLRKHSDHVSICSHYTRQHSPAARQTLCCRALRSVAYRRAARVRTAPYTAFSVNEPYQWTLCEVR